MTAARTRRDRRRDRDAVHSADDAGSRRDSGGTEAGPRRRRDHRGDEADQGYLQGRLRRRSQDAGEEIASAKNCRNNRMQAGNELSAALRPCSTSAEKLAIDSGDLLAVRIGGVLAPVSSNLTRPERLSPLGRSPPQPRPATTIKVLHDEATSLFGPSSEASTRRRQALRRLRAQRRRRRMQNQTVVKVATDRNTAWSRRRTEWKA